MNSSSGWFNASNEDGNLYARAEALGASAVVLATRERTVTYLATNSSSSSVVAASSNETKIDEYEQRIARHQAEIVKIKNGDYLYSELSKKEKLGYIKSKEDGILACEAAIHDLRAQQQQSNGK